MDALKALVTSEARARVLTAFFGEPERSYYQAELAKSLDLPLLAVQRELKRLDEAGLIRSERLGGRRVYRADPAAAVHGDLVRLIIKTRGVAARLRSVLQGRTDVELAWIFGSVAAGSATARSDVDLMVLGTVPARDLRRVVGPIERDLGRTVNEHVVPPSEWTARFRRRDGFVSQVRRSPKLWVIGDERSLHRLDRRP